MRNHNDSVHTQFDPRAASYLTSAVHAGGPDLTYARELLQRNLSPTGAALDVGCGAGHLSFALASHLARVVACDPSDNMLNTVAAAARDRKLVQIETASGFAAALPFVDAEFELVATRFSAHHWRELAPALREMRRVLKPHGHILIIDVMGDEDALVDTHLQTLELLRDPSHVRDRSATEWSTLLNQANFEVLEQQRWPLRLEFKSWVERMQTPPDRVAMLRSIEERAPREVRETLLIEADGTFTCTTGLWWGRRVS
jgi:ubiquinone/menaquinone biosynthesis C-methylase UbiE